MRTFDGAVGGVDDRFLGTPSELLLLNHLESWTQWIPVVLLAVALVLFVWLVVRYGALPHILFQATMAFFVAAGVIGIALHYNGAREFQLEVAPTLSGTALFWKTVKAKAPPALAPASMIGLGLIGFAYTFTLKREQ